MTVSLLPGPALHPLLAEAHRRSDAGDLAGARGLYQSLIDQPEFTSTCLYRLGLIAGAGGDHRRAAALTRQAIRLQGDLWEAYPVLSTALQRSGDFNGAMGALIEFGCALDQAQERERAAQVFRQVLERDPLNYAAWHNGGRCLAWLGRPREAAPYVAQALRLYGRLHSDIAALIGEIEAKVGERLPLGAGALPEGLPHGRVDLVENALTTLGKILSDEHFIDAAVACQRLAVQLAPGYALAHWNLAQALLVQGHWHEGWREYEWRWEWPECPEPLKRVAVPTWQGEPVQGKRVLVWTEQGLGDAIQFLPLVRKLLALGAEVVVETPATLRPLFANSMPEIEVVNRPERPDLLATAKRPDFIVPLMSLASRFDLTQADLPLALDYLKAPKAQIETWAARLPARPPMRVGVAWAGRTNAIPFESCARLLKVPAVTWCSLQVGPEQARLNQAGLPQVMDLSPMLRDFADTAAAITSLDLVIAIDTAVAHLAAALGKPVWVLLNHQPNWRWSGGTDRCHWYPSMRLFRRGLRQDWSEVIQQVCAALESWSTRAGPGGAT